MLWNKNKALIKMKTFSKYVKAALVWANGMGYDGDKKKQAMFIL